MVDPVDKFTTDMFPDPAARRSDPVTSHLAAASAKDLAIRHRHVILTALRRYGPMGKDGIAARTRLDGVAVCRRLSEMQRAGQIEPTGRTTQSTSGRAEREWRVCLG